MGKDLTQKKPTSGNGTRLSARVTASGGRQGPRMQMVLGRVFHVPGAAFFSDFSEIGHCTPGHDTV